MVDRRRSMRRAIGVTTCMMVTGATAFVRPLAPARTVRTNPPRFYAAANNGDGDEYNAPPSGGELLDAAMDWKATAGFQMTTPVSELSDSDLMLEDDEDEEEEEEEEEEASFNDMLEFGAADSDDFFDIDVDDDDDDDANEEIQVMQVTGPGQVMTLSSRDAAAAASTVLDVLEQEKLEEEEEQLQQQRGQASQSTSVKKAADKGSSTLPRRFIRPPVPIVAVLGRPNVGKSALANRISGKHNRGAIVHDEVGVTRDRTYLRSFWGEKTFDVVDTGGLVFDDDQSSLFLEQIRQQAAIALTEAAVAVLVVDGQSGRTALDEQVATFLRKEWASKIPVLVAVTKCESITVGNLQASEFWSLGLGEPLPVSGIHGTGVAELLEAIEPHLYEVTEQQLAEEEVMGKNTVSVSLVGRPNVGKSSMFNRLYGEARAIVSPIAGTTRDTLDAELEKDGRIYKFVDTAGIRRRGKVQYGSEFFMVNRALKAIRRSDVVLLVLDAVLGVSDQDRVLAQRVADDGRACVVLLNKWDSVENKDDKTYLKSIEYVRDMLPAVRWAPVVLVSALTGQRCPKIYDAVDEAVKNHRARISTAALNDVLRDAILWQPPPALRGNKGQGKVYYVNQVAHSPPTLCMFCNKPGLFSDNYRRYLERKFRESLGFEGTPIKFIWRGKRVRAMQQDNRRSSPPKSSSKPLQTSPVMGGAPSPIEYDENDE